MPKEKPELSDAMKKKLAGKTFEKTEFKEQNTQLPYQVQKEELENLLLLLIFLLLLKKLDAKLVCLMLIFMVHLYQNYFQ